MSELKDKAIDIKGRFYVLVKDRVLHFNDSCPNGKIVTELLSALDSPQVVIKATVTPDTDKESRYFTGHSQAVVGDGYINKTAALENAETSAIGRALAAMGIGVLDSIASADEMRKAENASKALPPLQPLPQGTFDTKTAQNAVYAQSGHTESQSKPRNYTIRDTGHGTCDHCGAFKTLNPKTGKIFCQAMCWLKKNQEKQEPGYDNKYDVMDPKERVPEQAEITEVPF